MQLILWHLRQNCNFLQNTIYMYDIRNHMKVLIHVYLLFLFWKFTMSAQYFHIISSCDQMSNWWLFHHDDAYPHCTGNHKTHQGRHSLQTNHQDSPVQSKITNSFFLHILKWNLLSVWNLQCQINTCSAYRYMSWRLFEQSFTCLDSQELSIH